MPSNVIFSCLYLVSIPYLIIVLPLCLYVVGTGFSAGPIAGIKGILFSLDALGILMGAWFLSDWIFRRYDQPMPKPSERFSASSLYLPMAGIK